MGYSHAHLIFVPKIVIGIILQSYITVLMLFETKLKQVRTFHTKTHIKTITNNLLITGLSVILV